MRIQIILKEKYLIKLNKKTFLKKTLVSCAAAAMFLGALASPVVASERQVNSTSVTESSALRDDYVNPMSAIPWILPLTFPSSNNIPSSISYTVVSGNRLYSGTLRIIEGPNRSVFGGYSVVFGGTLFFTGIEQMEAPIHALTKEHDSN